MTKKFHHILYGALVLGFLLKAVGASWDASYHFKHLREFYQLPHIINGAGDILVLLVLFYLWKREPKEEKKDLKLILGGILFYGVAILFDQWWHVHFGLDLTAWSLSHFTLYTGTAIALLGAIVYIARDWRHGSISGKTRVLYLFILF